MQIAKNPLENAGKYIKYVIFTRQSKIAEELTAEKILTPAAHWRNIGERTSMGAHNADPCKWSIATVIQILKKEEYIGSKVLNKTGKESYKSKKRQATPENKLIF